jgi:flagellar hook protein FlgE
MTGFALFQPSVLGMRGQSQALSAISGNVANVATTAYKRNETTFETLVSRAYAGGTVAADATGALSRQADLGGVSTKMYARVDDQGELAASGRALDLAINGNGFFVLSGTGGTMFGRDGRFGAVAGAEIEVTGPDGAAATGNESFLADSAGNLLQGWRVRPDGSVAADAAGLEPVRVDAAAFASQSRATSAAGLALNLPAAAAIGSQQRYGFDAIDSAGTAVALTAVFTRTAGNTWSLDVVDDAGNPAGLSPAAPVGFTALGGLNGAARYQVSAARPDGAQLAFSLDLAGSTQFAAPFDELDFNRDGYVAGTLDSVGFAADGYVEGHFSNGRSERLYRLPIATFANPDGLARGDGNAWQASALSGDATLRSAGDGGAGDVAPATLERSNVDLADEFSRMIMTQNAYQSSATAFRTLDEVLETARDLKR